MVMFKAKFRPMSDKPRASESDKVRRPGLQQQQQQQPAQPKVPPIEEERGPQHPIREPEPTEAPERARGGR
ncbi:MAG TPA: hypothetical protein VHL79_04450 [Ramlibacter sp.]|jgi:hypothetical protein|nr:hypothetical protein [Ramlibacter sp.]